MKKINKEFEERCIRLRNRIQRLKTEEENYNKKLKNFKRREEQDKLIKNEKERLKLELQKNKEERNKALNIKRNKIRNKKENDNKIKVDRKNANFSQKKSNYNNLLSDKYLMKIIKEQLDTQQKNKNIYSHAKVKQEYNEYEANKMKRNIERENLLKMQHENNIKQLKELEKEMRDTCEKLEVKEKEYIEKLNKTKYMSMKTIKDNKSFNYNAKINYNRKKLFTNKSMQDIIINGSTDEGEYKNRNRSVIVNKNKALSPGSKSQRNMTITKKPKSKKKFESYVSINYFPGTNKAKNSNKIGLNNNNKSVVNNKEKENKQIKKNLFKNNNKSINK